MPPRFAARCDLSKAANIVHTKSADVIGFVAVFCFQSTNLLKAQNLNVTVAVP